MGYLLVIKEAEFDELNFYQQRNFRYCPKCNRYWNTKLIDKCVCYYEDKAKEIYANEN